MIKRYKGFYPSWYIKKNSNKNYGKLKKYLMFILVMNLVLIPQLVKKPVYFIESESKEIYKQVNVLEELGFLFQNNIENFKIENKNLEFKISKNDFKENIKTLEKKIGIQSIEEIFEESAYLIKGEFYDK